ncbi:hypothetical protein [Aeromicrobium sp.]|uniref:hypothetical protein n=1 Tax=Aeromicrobium sp. TaxID=1871063 RepID=UPI002FC63ED5
MSELRTPAAIVLMAAVLAFVGNGIDNEQLRSTCLSGAGIVFVVGLVTAISALLGNRGD